MRLAIIAQMPVVYENDRLYCSDHGKARYIEGLAEYFPRVILCARQVDPHANPVQYRMARGKGYLLRHPNLEFAPLPDHLSQHPGAMQVMIKHWRTLRRLWELIPQWDALFIWMPTVTPIFAWLLARLFRKPYIVYVMGHWESIVPTLQRWQGVRGRLFLLLGHLTALAHKAMIAHAPVRLWEAELLYKQFQADGKPNLLLTTGALNKAPFYHRTDTCLTRPITVLSIGTLIERKGYRYLIDALAVLRQRGHEVNLWIVGEGEQREALERQVEQLALAACVRFWGQVAWEEVFALCQQSDLFALPSLSEGMPRVIAEAMSQGLPVVATCVGAIPERLAPGEEALLVEPARAAALADAIEQILVNETLRRRLIRNGYRWAHEEQRVARDSVHHTVVAIRTYLPEWARLGRDAPYGVVMRQRPNVLFIVLDTVRASNLSCYGYERPTTPHLDAIARNGVRLTHLVSASPWTLPSHASIFTGLFPSQHGAHALHKFLDFSHTTMAELFQRNGYRTAALTMNSWISDTFGMARGFDTFLKMWQLFQSRQDINGVSLAFGKQPVASLPREVLARLLRGNGFKNIANLLYGYKAARRYDYAGRRITATAKRWLQRNAGRDKPFFLFINYLEAHLQYKPPPAWAYLYGSNRAVTDRLLGLNQIRYAWSFNMSQAQALPEEERTALVALYDAELTYLDTLIGQIYAFLQRAGLLDNTILVITSDHGENIGDHQLMDHQLCLYDTLLRVPALLHWPGHLAAGVEIGKLTQSVDWLPTLIEMAALEDEGLRQSLPGLSLFSPQAHPFAISEYMGPQPPLHALKRLAPDAEPEAIRRFDRSLRAIQGREWKYIWASDGEHELYNLATDPQETHNLRGEHPQIASHLQACLTAWEAQSQQRAAPVAPSEPLIPDDVRHRLEALGYL